MSGHSKWATTKHKKAVIDARRGKMFAKLIKNIEVAARMGGGDPAGNPTLYDAIQKAKKSSVPNDNIDRAVKRGSGAEAGGADYDTIMYEGYGPQGVALPHRVPHRQPEPRRDGGPHRDDPQRRHHGRPGLGLAPVQPQGRRDRAEGAGERARSTRTTCSRPPSTPAPRRSTTSTSRSRSSPRPPTWSPSAPRSRTPAIDYDSAEVQFVASMDIPVDEDAAARSSASSTRSRTSTTCRTSSPTSTSPTTCWPALDV